MTFFRFFAKSKFSADELVDWLQTDLPLYILLRVEKDGFVDGWDDYDRVQCLVFCSHHHQLEISIYYSQRQPVMQIRGMRSHGQNPADLSHFAKMLAQDVFCVLERRGLRVDYVRSDLVWDTL